MDPFNEPLNEIIFENRNKTYGAYVLRKEYADNLKFGILLCYAFVATIVVLGVLLSGRELIPPKIKLDDAKEIFVEPLHKTDLTTKPENPQPKKKKAVPVIPKENVEKVASNDPVEQKPEKEKVTEIEEPEHGLVEENNGGVPDGSEKGSVEINTTETESNKVVLAASKMPTIEGGIPQFLLKNLKYPEIAVEKRTSGVVYISFVIEKDGSVSNIKILNEEKVGDGCEEEAIRVVKSAKWIPGENNGTKVRVQFTLPVRYKIQ